MNGTLPFFRIILVGLVVAGCAPLNDDVKHHNISQLEADLASGTSVNSTDISDRTPLWIAAYYNDFDAVKVLLKAGANPNIVDSKHHDSPLMLAAANGSIDMVNELLTANANTNLLNVDGWTALHCAMSGVHPDIIRILVAHGADPQIRNRVGQLPEDMATSSLEVDALHGK